MRLLSALLILTTATYCTATDERQNSTWNLESNPPRSHPEDHMDLPWTIPLHRFPNQGLLSVTREERKKTVVTPEKKSAVTPEKKIAVTAEKTVVTPDKKTVVTPQKKTVVTPQKKTMVIPEKKTVVTPEKKTVVAREKKTAVTLDKKAKLAVDNNTGLRKSSSDEGNRLPTNVFPAGSPGNEFTNTHKPLQDGNLLDSAFASPILHGADELPDHENNRPGKISLQKLIEHSYNSSKPGWMTNRQPSSILYQFHGFRKEFESKERSCLMDCHKNRDEREAYCNSDFAVNGIVHDVDTLGKGIQLLTILVNSGGLYKINRLYITPDGYFFKVKVLAVDHLNCPKSCLDFKLGGRYIIMGRIFHKRMELSPSIQRTLSGRLRAGDGLVTSSSSFVRRYNRKKDRKVLAAAHSKCK